MKDVATLLLFLLGSLTVSVSAQTPPGFSPSTSRNLYVEFDDVTVIPGKLIPLEFVATSPRISFPYRAAEPTHLVLMIDLDAPFADVNRSYSPLLHWLQPSIPATLCTIPDNYTNPDISAVAPYISPQPPSGSAPHRYILLAFRQPQKNFSMPIGFLKYYDPDDVETRFRFNVASFIKEAGLTLVAANWFTAQDTTST